MTSSKLVVVNDVQEVMGTIYLFFETLFNRHHFSP